MHLEQTISFVRGVRDNNIVLLKIGLIFVSSSFPNVSQVLFNRTDAHI
jgi:hypothetical protein